MKIPEKIKSVRFVSGARLCHEHKMSATTNNFFFEKKIMARESWKYSFYVLFLSFEPGSNPARTRTLFVLPGPGPCRPVESAPGPKEYNSNS
jgi:hypothetical protein